MHEAVPAKAGAAFFAPAEKILPMLPMGVQHRGQWKGSNEGAEGRQETIDGKQEKEQFCRNYLRTMDPERAAETAGCRDGYGLLGQVGVRRQLEKMRSDTAGQIRREDVVRRLAQLAFGSANDALKLALHPETADAGALDLSAVTEFKVTDKGVEVKLTDRIRALETLHGLLESGGSGAEELYRALEEAAEQMEDGWRDG